MINGHDIHNGQVLVIIVVIIIIIVVVFQDRYVLATMVCLACVCFWHGIQTLLIGDQYAMKDYYALIILGGLYIIYNVQFIIRLFLLVSAIRSAGTPDVKED